MSLLHVINKSPYEHSALDSCLRLAKKGTSILFIEDGTYAVRSGTPIADKVSRAVTDYAIYALTPDMGARGIHETHLVEGVSLVDYDGFVKLAAEHDKVKSWL